MTATPILVCGLLLIASCNSSKNNREALLFNKNGNYYLKLTGTRNLGSHNARDLLQERTYTDSFVLQIPTAEIGIIEGEKLPSRNGKYGFRGSMEIGKNVLTVRLLINDTDDHKLRPLTWNGDYILNYK